MNVKNDSPIVLGVVYYAYENQKKQKVNLTYKDLEREISNLELDDIKACVEYLANEKYLTYNKFPLFKENICITNKGINYYLENFN